MKNQFANNIIEKGLWDWKPKSKEFFLSHKAVVCEDAEWTNLSVV